MTDPDVNDGPDMNDEDEEFDDVDPFDADAENTDPDSPGYLRGTGMDNRW